MTKIVSEVQIVPIRPKDGLVAFASFVLFEAVYCGSIGIMTRPKGEHRLAFPTKKIGCRDLGIIYPISKQVGLAISEAVISKFEEVTKEENGRYGCVST